MKALQPRRCIGVLVSCLFLICVGQYANAQTSPDPQPAENKKPYDLRGIQLGMLLSEFRKLRHPDGLRGRVFCSNESESHDDVMFTVLDEEKREANVILCGYFEFKKDEFITSLPAKWLRLGLNVATVDVSPLYAFVRDSSRSNEFALYEIEFRAPVHYWSAFWEGYKSKYGKPTSISNSPTQNKAGATFDNTVVVWDNGVSSISLMKRFVYVNTSFIFYEHKRLAAQVKKRIRSKKGRPQDKL